MNRIIAIPVWNGRISPLMDTAGQLMIVTLEENSQITKTAVTIPQQNISGMINFLHELNINVLICGAISHQLEQHLASSDMEIYPWVGGDVDEIINAYFNGIISNHNFMLPGCGRSRRWGRGRHRRQFSGMGRCKQFKEKP